VPTHPLFFFCLNTVSEACTSPRIRYQASTRFHPHPWPHPLQPIQDQECCSLLVHIFRFATAPWADHSFRALFNCSSSTNPSHLHHHLQLPLPVVQNRPQRFQVRAVKSIPLILICYWLWALPHLHRQLHLHIQLEAQDQDKNGRGLPL